MSGKNSLVSSLPKAAICASITRSMLTRRPSTKRGAPSSPRHLQSARVWPARKRGDSLEHMLRVGHAVAAVGGSDATVDGDIGRQHPAAGARFRELVDQRPLLLG